MAGLPFAALLGQNYNVFELDEVNLHEIEPMGLIGRREWWNSPV